MSGCGVMLNIFPLESRVEGEGILGYFLLGLQGSAWLVGTGVHAWYSSQWGGVLDSPGWLGR
jgi:hypothetical protein